MRLISGTCNRVSFVELNQWSLEKRMERRNLCGTRRASNSSATKVSGAGWLTSMEIVSLVATYTGI